MCHCDVNTTKKLFIIEMVLRVQVIWGGGASPHLKDSSRYRPFSGGVASRLATAIYVAMVTPILYDNFYTPNDPNLKYESHQP